MITIGSLCAVIIVTLDPNNHRVWTVFPLNTTICTCSSIIYIGNTRHIRPWFSKCHITRRSGTNTHCAYPLVLDFQCRTRTTCCLVRKVLVNTHLRHIGVIPILWLLHICELSTAPIFKTRIGKLLRRNKRCHHRHQND